MRLLRVVFAVMIGFCGGLYSAAADAFACGAASDCRVGDRAYRIRMPDTHDGVRKVGAVVFMHGYRGTASGIMRNKTLTAAVSTLGLALIAPKSAGPDWDIPNAPRPGRRDELAFFDALVADVTARFSVDPHRLMASGFSAGGMMVWNLACHRSELFAGFAPIAGTFWAPVPPRCTDPLPHLMHIHGTADRVVPLEGRAIGPARQGNVYRAIDLWRGRTTYRDIAELTFGSLICLRQKNPAGKLLAFCRHSGGHTFRSTYVTTAWAQLKAAGAFD